MASVANGGSADDIAPGVDFFQQLNDAGNLLPVDPTSATIESGQTPVVIDWDYLNAAEAAKVADLEGDRAAEAVIAGYYFQAINADAPHPAAARLWEEFLYSDEGQNLWLAGGARPVRADAMVEAGTIDQALYDALPAVEGSRSSRPTSRPSRWPPTWRTTGRRPSAERLGTGAGRRHDGRTGPTAGRRFSVGPAVGLLPFLVYVLIFLIIPTITVAVGAFQAEEGGFTLERVQALGDETALARAAREPGALAVVGRRRCRPRCPAGVPRS